MQQKNESFNKKRYGSNKQDPDGDIQSRSTIHRLYRTLLYALFRSPLHLHPQQQEQFLFPNEADVFFVGDEAGAHGAEMWGFELAVDEGAAEFCELAGEENKG